jgi:hypothetical protein
MIFRNLDENSDWRFGKGRNDFTQRNQAIGLNIRTRLLSWFGDCFFAQNEGVDWYNRLGSKNQQTLLEADIRRIILQSEGVTGILTFDTILEGRSFTANYSVSTIFSESYRDSIILGS